ncbi:MAG: hypothetical protein N3G80_03245, partial [Candidatus Micrarchaeota archaeon]|nr:hypothetical protein [Candidatus Micrarchaeota archaeon]
CSALPITASISNSSPGAGSEVNLSINITNNLTKEIQIMNITLSNSTLGSGFSLISPFLPLPAVISPSASQQFYARLRVPPSNGQKEIKLNITYMPTSADCTGSRPTCNLSEIHALSINVGPSAGPDYAIVSLRFEPQQVPLFGRTRLTIEVKNIGNQNAANNTTTWVNGCELQTLPLKPLAAGETANQTVLCRCRQIGMQNVYVEVNKERTQYETNYTNNIRDAQYLCNIIQPQCSDFV